MKQFQTLGTDPYEVIRLFPDLVSQAANANEINEPETATTPRLQDRDLENGLLALIAYLTEVRHNLMGGGDSTKEERNEKGKDKTKNITAVATEQLLKIIDTTLLKCYLQVRVSDFSIKLGNCLTPNNFADQRRSRCSSFAFESLPSRRSRKNIANVSKISGADNSLSDQGPAQKSS